MRELMSYLPENYPASRETVAFQEALQPEARALWEVRDDLLAQLDPYTAVWGLDYWEAALGLANGLGLDLDTRRRVVVAKLQGRATTTPKVVKTVAETLLGVNVEVVEIFDEYTVLLSTPAGFQPAPRAVRLREQMRDIMPAHLDFQLVLPAAVDLPISLALGPRVSVNGAPPARGGPLGASSYATPLLGVNFSVSALPMAAREKGG